MSTRIHFILDRRGLATIEWVAICAVALLAAVAISGVVLGGADQLGGAVADQMSAAADQMSQ